MRTLALLVLPALAAAQTLDDVPAAGGGTGLYRAPAADAGAAGVWRAQLAGAFFQSSSFPSDGARNRFLGGELALGWTPLRGIQSFLSYRATSNFNEKSSPRLVQTQGDISLGGRAGLEVLDDLWLAADLAVGLHNAIGGDTIAPGATELLARGVASYGIDAFDEVPLRAHASFGARLGRAGGLRDPAKFDPGLQFGIGLSSFHRLVWSVGMQADLRWLAPFLEVTSEIPLGTDAGALALGGARITPGLRMALSRAIWITLAAEIGLGGQVAAGFAGPPPYQLAGAVGVALDPVRYDPPPPPPPEPVERVVTVPGPPPPPTDGALVGTVTDLAGAPLTGAVISVSGALPAASGADGRYRLPALQPGAVTARAERPGYLPSEGSTEIAAGKESPLDLRLAAEPPAGTVVGRLTSDGSTGLPGQISAAGQLSSTAADGAFALRLPPGQHRLVGLATGRLARAALVTVGAGGFAPAALALPPRADAPALTVAGDLVILVRPWKLRDERAEPPPEAGQALDELADLLLTQAGIARLVVAAHAEATREPPEARLALTQGWADAIKAALVARGVAPEKVEAVGKGAAAPLDPKSKEKNRRLELVLVRE